MYITCEQCSTIFRLDEKLLKQTGSKVRCSQCGNVFIAKPPTAASVVQDEVDSGHSDVPANQFQDTYDQELEGIDLDELDSILEQGRSTESDTKEMLQDSEDDEAENLAELDEADFDMDFEFSLEQEGTAPQDKKGLVEPKSLIFDPPDDQADEEAFDWDMKFELDDDVDDEPFISGDEQEASDDVDMEMDFDLEDRSDEPSEAQPFEEIGLQEEEVYDDIDDDEPLDEDVELALDDFEDVLGGADGKDPGDPLSIEISDEKFDTSTAQGPDSGLDAEAEPIVEAGDKAEPQRLDDKDDIDLDISKNERSFGDPEDNDLDIPGLDNFLDEDENDLENPADSEEIELSLDNDFKMAFDEKADDSNSTFAATTFSEDQEDQDDDLDLDDLDELLDEVDDPTSEIDTKNEAFSLGEESDIGLDEGDHAEKPHISEKIEEDFDLDDLGGLLDESEDEPEKAEASESDEDFTLIDDLEPSLDEADAPKSDLSPDESEIEEDFDLDDLGVLFDESEDEPEKAEASESDEDFTLIDDLEPSLDEADAPKSDLSPDESEIEEDFDLDDLGVLFDESEDEPEKAEASESDEDLTLMDELELNLDEADAPKGDLSPDESEIEEDFDLDDLGGLLDESEGQPEKAEASESDEDLTLVDELELDLDEADAPKGDLSPDESEIEEDFDLDDLGGLLDESEDEPEKAEASDANEDLTLVDDLELSLDEADAPKGDLSPDKSEIEEDFDLDDLGGLLDESEDEPEKAEASDADEDLTLVDDLEQDLDEEESGLKTNQGDEFDLSDFDGMLSDDAEPSKSVEDLNAESASELEAQSEIELSVKDDEDFELSLDDESEDNEIMDEDKQDESLDLTDIEKMLEDDSIVSKKDDTAKAVETDSAGAEKWPDEENGDLEMTDDEIDLSEIEEAIDTVGEDENNKVLMDENQELELDIDLESEKPKDKDDTEDFELELEMDDSSPLKMDSPEDSDDEKSDFSVGDEPTIETEVVDAGDIQLEFQIEDNSDQIEAAEQPSKVAGGQATTGFIKDEDDFSENETIAAEQLQESPADKMVSPPQKTGMPKLLLVILLPLILLGLGGYFGYQYVVANDIKIPFISDFINPEPNDPSGINKLFTLEINSKFIDNQSSGRMFIITGKVRNDYSIARKLIRLRGKLFSKGKKLVKTEHSFAGLVISDQELTSNSIEDIKKRLSSTKDQDVAVTIEAGKSAPFMIVFSELPTDLDEFVIELVSSIKAQ